MNKNKLKTLTETNISCTALARRVRFGAVIVLLVMLTACASVTSTRGVTVPENRSWSLLPFSNLSATPRAEAQLAELVEMSLRSRGIRNIKIYKPSQPESLRSLFDDSAQMRVAAQWARRESSDYALTGVVHEWQYRSGADKEPTVGVTLKLLDVKTGQVMWQGNAAKTGAGFTNLSKVASQLVNELLSDITLSESPR